MEKTPAKCECGHPADMRWEWAPGHGAGVKCDCCAKEIWENTLANVTKGLAELTVRCPPRGGSDAT